MARAEIRKATADFAWISSLVKTRLEPFAAVLTATERDQLEEIMVAALLDDSRVRQLLGIVLGRIPRRRRRTVRTPLC